MTFTIPDSMHDLFMIVKPYALQPWKATGDGDCCCINLQEGRKIILIDEAGSFTAQLVEEDGEKHGMCDLGPNPGAHLVLVGYLHDEIP